MGTPVRLFSAAEERYAVALLGRTVELRMDIGELAQVEGRDRF